MDEIPSIEHDLQRLEAELRRLEAEYNMFFSGRSSKPPLETRRRVEALVKRHDRAHIRNYADRFKFSTLQARFSALVGLWDRSVRTREEGRAVPSTVTRDRPPVADGPSDVTVQLPSSGSDGLEHRQASRLEERPEIGEDAASVTTLPPVKPR